MGVGMKKRERRGGGGSKEMGGGGNAVQISETERRTRERVVTAVGERGLCSPAIFFFFFFGPLCCLLDLKKLVLSAMLDRVVMARRRVWREAEKRNQDRLMTRTGVPESTHTQRTRGKDKNEGRVSKSKIQGNKHINIVSTV
jgi:hypothetical protein